MRNPSALYRLARVVAALAVALAVAWPAMQDASGVGYSLVALGAYWALFTALFEVGAAGNGELWMALTVAIALSFIAPYVASFVRSSSFTGSSLEWMGLSFVFVIAAVVAAV